MGRRKQAKPMKCEFNEEEENIKQEEEQDAFLPPKKIKLESIVKEEPQVSLSAAINYPSTSTGNYCSSANLNQPSVSSTSKENPLAMMEKSLRRLSGAVNNKNNNVSRVQTTSPSVPNYSCSGANGPWGNSGLGALYQFVGKVANETPLVSREKDEGGVTSILKCLQCGRGFDRMELLVKHMQDTKHFNNLPKSYSSVVQMEKQKVLSVKLQAKSDGFRLSCITCGEMPENMERHVKERHGAKTSADWLKHVRLQRTTADKNILASPTDRSKLVHKGSNTLDGASSPHLNKLLSLVNTVTRS